MTKRIYFISLILILAACQPQLPTAFYKGQEVTLTASVPNTSSVANSPLPQRITGLDSNPQSTTDGAINLSWSAGDQILVLVNDLPAVFHLTSGEGTDQATFCGTMSADGTEYHVSYPVAYHDSLLRHQNYVKNGFGNGLMKMRTHQAGTLDRGFELHADNALLGLQLTGDHTLGRVIVTNLSNDSTYTLHCDGVCLQSATATLFYLVVPVAGWMDGMRVEVYDTNGKIILRKEKTGAMTFSAAEAIVMPALETREPGKRIGIFSVSANKKVSFAQGNLQYIQSTKTWQFARNQFEHIGAANVKNGALADHIDLFGWSSDSGKAPFGISTSMNTADYQGNFVDWGTNAISGDAPGTWRTLSVDEWDYLFNKRQNAKQLYSKGNVDGLRGMILLPDDWELPSGLHFTAQPTNLTMKLDINTYTQAEWQRMEEAGAVFFCPTGRRDQTTIGYLDYYGCYWSRSRTADGIHTRHMYFNYSYQIFTTDYQSGEQSYGTNGRAVRLVHDTIVPEYVDLGLSVKWAKCNLGASTATETGDFYAWGEIEPKVSYTYNNYQWWNGSSANITKYCTIDSLAYAGIADGLTELQLQDDAAYVQKGAPWRMPTSTECEELMKGCTWHLVNQNGQVGFKGISKVNGNTIFLPVVGFRAHENIVSEYIGGYWSSTLNTQKQHCALGIYLNVETISVGKYFNSSRQNGFLIRPVFSVD
jgi:hypothetical protein